MPEIQLNKDDFLHAVDPFLLFNQWFDAAQASEVNDPNAFSLATVDEFGMPNARMVLLKGHDLRGFVFYTNFESTKGLEILRSLKAAMCFHWKTQLRQVRIRGEVEIVSNEEADIYYYSRARESRIGAWASHQSRPLENREILEQNVFALTQNFADQELKRPPHWSGFRIIPCEIEFWQDGTFRLHDRLKFTRASPQHEWNSARLYP
jgi:pyridoxamine 5'-phosphate oxidase